ncbi:MAG: chemotaxis protein CheC [Coxiellaceae bacterium]|nr:chemotaxis protein CheC [Coxiellaceae bacterium]
MRPLTAMERDALIEVCNIGVSQAAKQLSILLNDEVVITVPEVQLSDVDGLAKALNVEKDEKVSCVKQQLKGDLAGSALLMFHNDESKALVSSLVGSTQMLGDLSSREFEHEAVMEIGNIIISACFSAIGNFLHQDISFTVPTYFEADAEGLSKGVDVEGDTEYKAVIVIDTTLNAYRREVSGALLISFTVPSMEHVTNKLAELVGGIGL